MSEDVLMMVEPRPVALAQLEATYRLHRWDQAADKDAFLAEFGPRCRAVVTNGHCALTRDTLAHLPNLEVVACSSAGFEEIDDVALAVLGIPLTNSSAALCDEVADLALLLVLATGRHLVRAHDYVQSGDWEEKGPYPLLHATRGKRLGILGLGQIGKAIATRCEPLGLEISYSGRSKKPGVSYEYQPDLVDLARTSDILVVVVPGGDETRGVISRAVLDALGPEGTLINVARGSVVDEAELISALRDGRLGSAGLDVYLNEPAPDSELTCLPNVTLYPHHASGTIETRDAMAQTVVDNLAAHFAGQPLLNKVG